MATAQQMILVLAQHLTEAEIENEKLHAQLADALALIEKLTPDDDTKEGD